MDTDTHTHRHAHTETYRDTHVDTNVHTDRQTHIETYRQIHTQHQYTSVHDSSRVLEPLEDIAFSGQTLLSLTA